MEEIEKDDIDYLESAMNKVLNRLMDVKRDITGVQSGAIGLKEQIDTISNEVDKKVGYPLYTLEVLYFELDDTVEALKNAEHHARQGLLKLNNHFVTLIDNFEDAYNRQEIDKKLEEYRKELPALEREYERVVEISQDSEGTIGYKEQQSIWNRIEKVKEKIDELEEKRKEYTL